MLKASLTATLEIAAMATWLLLAVTSPALAQAVRFEAEGRTTVVADLVAYYSVGEVSPPLTRKVRQLRIVLDDAQWASSAVSFDFAALTALEWEPSAGDNSKVRPIDGPCGREDSARAYAVLHLTRRDGSRARVSANCYAEYDRAGVVTKAMALRHYSIALPREELRLFSGKTTTVTPRLVGFEGRERTATGVKAFSLSAFPEQPGRLTFNE